MGSGVERNKCFVDGLKKNEVEATAEPIPIDQINHARFILTRRQFLVAALGVAAAELLAGCRPSQGVDGGMTTAVPLRVLESPVPVATAEPTPMADGGELALEEFLALSAVLTGFTELDPVVGRVYLQSLQQSAEFDLSLPELYEAAGFRSAAPPNNVTSLEDNDFFAAEANRALADAIIEQWYTGVYQQDGEAVVATFVDSLTWKAINFTKPLTICDPPGRWAERPDADVGG